MTAIEPWDGNHLKESQVHYWDRGSKVIYQLEEVDSTLQQIKIMRNNDFKTQDSVFD
jgi:hypothetical protein